MQLEVEIKTKLEGPERSQILAYLHDHGAELLREIIEEDLYFNSPQVDFKETDEALRLRRTRLVGETNDANRDGLLLTYKGPKIHVDSKTRREINIELKKDQAKSFTALFRSLGYYSGGTVIKTRIEMSYKGFVICLDRIDGLGDFMEIEKIVTDGKLVDEIVEGMKSLFPGLAGKEWIRESYLEMCMKGGN